jgi:hypothetical protein
MSTTGFAHASRTSRLRRAHRRTCVESLPTRWKFSLVAFRIREARQANASNATHSFLSRNTNCFQPSNLFRAKILRPAKCVVLVLQLLVQLSRPLVQNREHVSVGFWHVGGKILGNDALWLGSSRRRRHNVRGLHLGGFKFRHDLARPLAFAVRRERKEGRIGTHRNSAVPRLVPVLGTRLLLALVRWSNDDAVFGKPLAFW